MAFSNPNVDMVNYWGIGPQDWGLELHRNDGIDYFKIDGVKAITKEGERNLRRMFDRVQKCFRGSFGEERQIMSQ